MNNITFYEVDGKELFSFTVAQDAAVKVTYKAGITYRDIPVNLRKVPRYYLEILAASAGIPKTTKQTIAKTKKAMLLQLILPHMPSKIQDASS